MKILLLILLFLAASALLIISNNDLALYKQKNLEKFTELYVWWLDNLYSNVQTIAGQAVKLVRLPE